MLSMGDLLRARYTPELLPYTAALNIPGNGATLAFDARRFGDWLFILDGLAVDQHPSVAVRLYRDDEQRTYSASALRNGELEPFWLPATRRLAIELVNLGASPITGYRLRAGIWAMRPSAAQRLRYAIDIPSNQQAVAEQVRDQVDRGILPVSLAYVLDREYVAHALAEEVVARTVDVGPSLEPLITVINPQRGQAVILRSVSITPSTASQALRVVVDRDEIREYATIEAAAVTAATQDVPCWIPAQAELRVYLRSAAAMTGVQVRLRLLTVPITQVLAARWGLGSVPAEVAERVQGGVL